MTTYSGNCTDCVEIGTASLVESLVQRVIHGVKILGLKASVARERQHLLGMSDSMLLDIGVTREQALEESQRVDIPENRLKAMDSQA